MHGPSLSLNDFFALSCVSSRLFKCSQNTKLLKSVLKLHYLVSQVLHVSLVHYVHLSSLFFFPAAFLSFLPTVGIRDVVLMLTQSHGLWNDEPVIVHKPADDREPVTESTDAPAVSSNLLTVVNFAASLDTATASNAQCKQIS